VSALNKPLAPDKSTEQTVIVQRTMIGYPLCILRKNGRDSMTELALAAVRV
jgi:hypothetical protein